MSEQIAEEIARAEAKARAAREKGNTSKKRLEGGNSEERIAATTGGYAMTKAEKKKRLSQIVERLKEIYPNAECALHYGGDPWKLMVMGRLSAQCSDLRSFSDVFPPRRLWQTAIYPRSRRS